MLELTHCKEIFLSNTTRRQSQGNWTASHEESYSLLLRGLTITLVHTECNKSAIALLNFSNFPRHNVTSIYTIVQIQEHCCLLCLECFASGDSSLVSSRLLVQLQDTSSPECEAGLLCAFARGTRPEQKFQLDLFILREFP